MLLSVIDEAAHEQIEFAVVVVIKPDGACRPTGHGESGLGCHVRKRTVAVVAIKYGPPIRRHEEVGETIIVVIAHGYAHAEGPAGDAGLLRNVREGSVAVVLVQRISERRFRLEKVA